MTSLRVLALSLSCLAFASVAPAAPHEQTAREQAPETQGMTEQIKFSRVDHFVPVTRDQAIARASARFDHMDLNHDGVLTRDEFRQVRAKRKEAASRHFGPDANRHPEQQHPLEDRSADHLKHDPARID